MATGPMVGGWFATGAMTRLVEAVSSDALKQYPLLKGLQDDLMQLETALRRVHGLLSIADVKGVKEGAPLDRLLWELKEVACGADDLLDDFQFEYEEESNNIQIKVKNIQSRLYMVADGMGSILALVQPDARGKQQGMISHRETSSFLKRSCEFVGREIESQKIIDVLLKSDPADHTKNPGVLPIVGIGGVGKTTLAQYVYKHCSPEQEHFHLKMWVCVSNDFDVKRLTKAIIEAACEEKPDADSLDMLQKILKHNVQYKRFLLVLDDVWNKDRDKWESLFAPLAFGLEGSKILVTTREHRIADMICTMDPVHLEGLDEDVYWPFFQNCAFGGNKNRQENQKLIAIGKRIAARLMGSPLAAKTIGSLLSTDLDEMHWRSILESELWSVQQSQTDIMRVLKLSYGQLPGQLKQCFAYCSLFPKDYKIEEESLIQMWMAQGYIEAERSKRLEDVGRNYCQELVSRSLFQLQDDSFSENFIIIHDLLHDLAQFVSADECRRVEAGRLESVSCMIRHLSVHVDMEEPKLFNLRDLCRFKKLRTLVLNDMIMDDPDCHGFAELFTEITSIRVLILSNCDLKELPESIGNLKHLRYLDISCNHQIWRVPESLGHLHNLQVLIVLDCRITSVPDGISNLINLRELHAERETLSKIAGIGKLTSLQQLSNFQVKKESGHKITELRDLKELRGDLKIRNLQNVENMKEASGSNLKNKRHITGLSFSWSSGRDTNSPSIDQEVLEGLQPHPNIGLLYIFGYGGVGFPSWFAIEGQLSNLETIRLDNCSDCVCLPPLGQLPFLKDLSIESFPAIKQVGGEEFYGNGQTRGFPSLEILCFSDMQGWEEWSGGEEEEEEERGNHLFPVLRMLTIQRCPKLRNIAIHLPLMLTELKINCCEELMSMEVERLKQLASLERLEIERCPKLGSSMSMALGQQQVSIQLLPSSLKYLTLWSCGDLSSNTWLPWCLRNLTSLQYLGIVKCPRVTSLPTEPMCCLTALTELFLSAFPDMVTFEGLRALPSLRALTIYKCPKLKLAASSQAQAQAQPKGRDQEEALTSLRELSVEDTSLLTHPPLRGALKSLEHLYINYSQQSDMFTGAEEQFLLQDLAFSLRRLEFFSCGNLKSLPPELHSLSSLKELRIKDCLKIQSLPEKGLPRSLTYLIIWGCDPVLKERCQKNTGADWHKIAHINHDLFDGPSNTVLLGLQTSYGYQ